MNEDGSVGREEESLTNFLSKGGKRKQRRMCSVAFSTFFEKLWGLKEGESEGRPTKAISLNNTRNILRVERSLAEKGGLKGGAQSFHGRSYILLGEKEK